MATFVPYAKQSFLNRHLSGVMNASLNGVPMRLNPTSVSLSYQVKTSEIPTLGGMVVQIFGVEMSDLVVTGTFGKGGYVEQLGFLNRMLAIAAMQSNQAIVTPSPSQPVRFVYPNRGFDFMVYLKDYTSQSGMAIDYENTNIAPDWQLTLFVDTDNTGGAMTKVATDAYIQRLSNGLGYNLSAYNGNLQASTVEEFLAQQGYANNPQGYLSAAFGSPAQQTASTATAGSGTAPTGGGAAATGADVNMTILGPDTATAQQMINFWQARGQPPKLTASIQNVIGWYLSEGKDQNVRGDVAFAQACWETGYFTNDDTSLNNYAGIGHPVSAPSGLDFASAQDGVRAQIQLLYRVVNGNSAPLAHPTVAPTWGGKNVTTWAGLAQNWAGDPTYATDIMSIYGQILAASK
jgi:Mannosyl-glycoprotein endo-beta-N-acetylglucosaminidase